MRMIQKHTMNVLLRMIFKAIGLPWARWILLAILCMNTEAALALTQTKTPASSANCTNASGIGTRSWSRATRAYLSDGSYATASVDGTTSNYLKCLNYGFSIPSGATVNGITVNVERKSSSTSNGGSQDAAMIIVKGGVLGSVNKATTTAYTKSKVSEAHGGGSDLWGQSWTSTDINSSSFGAAFAATKLSSSGSSQTVSVDVISITVTYSTDTTAPTVTSMSRANVSPTAAASVSWNVVFSEAVTGVNAADFSLVMSGITGAAISSVTGSGATWTVTASTGSGNGTLGLKLVDDDSIIDGSGNKLGGSGTGNGNFTGEVYAVDKLNPQVISINRAGSDPTNALSVAWTVVFSESVTGVNLGDFALAQTGSVGGAAISSLTGSNATYTVTASGMSGVGTLGLNLVDDDSITDVTGTNKLGGTGVGNANATGQVYTYDRTPVTVLSMACPGSVAGNQVSWTVSFSKSVTGVDLADFALAASGVSGAFISEVIGAGETWVVTANTGYGAGTLGLSLVDDDSIIDLVSNKLGGTGAGNGNFTGEVCTISSTPPLAAYRMDESAWNGTTAEVTDEMDNYPGTAKRSATTVDLSRALVGDPGTCRYGVFNNGTTVKGGYVELDADLPKFEDDFTVTAWIKTTDNSKGQQWIFADNATGKGYALVLGEAGTGTLRFYSDGSSPKNLDTGNVIANNTWYFVAAVADFSGDPNIVRKVYVFNASGALLSGFPISSSSTGWTVETGGLASIAGTAAASDSGNHFRGNLDEVRLYDKVLNQAALTALAQARHACGAGPDHVRLEHDGQGLSCQTETVAVTACAGFDAGSPATCTPYTGGIAGNVLVKSAGGTTLATLPFTLATGSSSATVTIPAQSAQTVTLETSALSVTPSNNWTCWNSSTATAGCSMPISACPSGGFNCLDSAITPYSSASARLYTKMAAIPFAFDVVALNASGATETSYAVSGGATKAVTVELVDGSGSTACASRAPISPAVSQTLTFGATDSGRKTSASMTVNKAYADLRCRVTDVTQSPSVVACSSDDFSVRPGGVTLSTVPTMAAPPSSASVGAIKAGAAFTLRAATTSSATDGYSGALAQNVSQLTAQIGSQDSTQVAGGVVGVLTPTTLVANAMPTSNANYSEVGYLYLAAGAYRDAAFTAVDQPGDCVAGSTSVGLSGGKYGCDIGNLVAVSLGRFIPDHFAITPTTLSAACPAVTPLTPFSYFGQDGLITTFKLTAQNLDNGLTQNYAGAFARFSLANYASHGFSASPLPTGSVMSSSATAPSGSWVAGEASVTAKHQVSRPTALSDEVMVTVKSLPVDSDGVTMSAATAVSSSPTALRYGRLRLQNVYGSERLALSVPLMAQYRSGGVWVRNMDDGCTSISVSNLNLTNYQGGINATNMGLGHVTGVAAFAAGMSSVSLSRPSPTPTTMGSLDLILNLGSSGAPLTCPTATPANPLGSSVSAARPYLSSDWCAVTTQDRDPSARATFGIYRSPLIYRRENH